LDKKRNGTTADIGIVLVDVLHGKSCFTDTEFSLSTTPLFDCYSENRRKSFSNYGFFKSTIKALHPVPDEDANYMHFMTCAFF